MSEHVDTPEARRDAAVAAVHAAGGSIRGIVPLADPATPDVIAAYRLDVGASSPAVLEALDAVRAATEWADEPAGLVPWTPVVDEGDEVVEP